MTPDGKKKKSTVTRIVLPVVHTVHSAQKSRDFVLFLSPPLPFFNYLVVRSINIKEEEEEKKETHKTVYGQCLLYSLQKSGSLKGKE